MDTFQEYTDPRLVALYDTLSASRADTAFYIRLARTLCVSSVVDIGCGTGLLACELAGRGHRVTAVDPSPAMLDFARRRPGGEGVRWIEGDASRLGEVQADLAIMTGHVAQVIGDDESWRTTLGATHRALRPGGRVAFESRNPRAQAWARWTPQASRRSIQHAAHGPIEVWEQLIEVAGARVRFEIHYRFSSSGEELVSTGELRFRTRTELTQSLIDAGFSVEHVFGDWDGQPVEAESREFIFQAVRG
ncbi:MAG TPA: class I SAM-dependent methyltransferase [bacterium]|nr:class I SAM-dependent methyltransferase [bacterium]